MLDTINLRALEKTVAESEVPALVMEVPTHLIVAASAPAVRMLSPRGGPVIGRRFDEFTGDEHSGALPLLMSGRLDGYETTHTLEPAGGGGSVTLWVRRADMDDEPRHVVAILTAAGQPTNRVLPKASGGAHDVPPVVGSAGADLLIDRISRDIEALVGRNAASLLGESLLTLVASGSAGRLLWGLAQATSHGKGAPLRLELLRAGGGSVRVQLLIVPLHPPASCAFSILRDVAEGGADGTGPRDLLVQLTTGIDALGTARQLAGLSVSNRHALSLLSARELDVVTRLLAGDRVPTIAQALFLSPSTVRNQLSSVFSKTGVHSQQELLDLLRDPDAQSGTE